MIWCTQFLPYHLQLIRSWCIREVSAVKLTRKVFTFYTVKCNLISVIIVFSLVISACVIFQSSLLLLLLFSFVISMHFMSMHLFLCQVLKLKCQIGFKTDPRGSALIISLWFYYLFQHYAVISPSASLLPIPFLILSFFLSVTLSLVRKIKNVLIWNCVSIHNTVTNITWSWWIVHTKEFRFCSQCLHGIMWYSS